MPNHRSADKDGSGTLDLNEVKTLVRGLVQNISDEDIASAFKNADKDGNGTIDFTGKYYIIEEPT